MISRKHVARAHTTGVIFIFSVHLSIFARSSQQTNCNKVKLNRKLCAVSTFSVHWIVVFMMFIIIMNHVSVSVENVLNTKAAMIV